MIYQNVDLLTRNIVLYLYKEKQPKEKNAHQL